MQAASGELFKIPAALMLSGTKVNLNHTAWGSCPLSKLQALDAMPLQELLGLLELPLQLAQNLYRAVAQQRQRACVTEDDFICLMGTVKVSSSNASNLLVLFC